MSRGSERHVFAGGNTSVGFYSHYDHLAPIDSQRILIIKGGPGVGKSTLMKQIGDRMQDAGYDVEYFHCSSDPNSLDGVRIPALEVAMVDGTAPHIIDPKHPGAVDEIVHLGDFWNEAGISAHKAEVLTTTAKVGRTFRRAYRFLAAAKSIYDDIEALNQEKFDVGRANETAASLILNIFGHRPVSADAGKVRHLFASAITPYGLVNHLDNLMVPIQNQYILLGSPGTGKSTVVKKVVDAAVERGFYVEAYHCALDPTKFEHIIIPALKTAVITSTPPHTYSANNAVTLNMDLCRNPENVQANGKDVEEDTRLFWDLLNRAISCLTYAKALHDKLEEYYIPNMDFTRVEAIREKLIERIMTYAKQPSRNGVLAQR